MPPLPEPDPDGLIPSERLPPIPPQLLRRDEADRFLDFLFSDIAHKPPEIRLTEGAAVARHLRAVAATPEAAPERGLLNELADVIWRIVLREAPGKISSARVATRFLRRYQTTYLRAFDVERAVARISAQPGGTEQFQPTGQPRLMALHLNATASGRRLREDLSERIYAAYHGLRANEIRGARRRIAEALNRNGHRVKTSTKRRREWEGSDVMERVKQHERRLKGQFRGNVRQGRDAAVRLHLYFFRTLGRNAKSV